MRGHLKMIFELLTTILLTSCLSLFIFLLFSWKMNISKDLTRYGTKSAKQKMNKPLNYGKMPPVYPNGWFRLLESSALKKGEVKHVAVLGQNFAVFRTKMGETRILDAYCPHLGANLAEGGIIKNDEIECPFHSWRFSGKTGQCTHIPSLSKKVPKTFKTKVWDCVEVNGFIFVWYHAEAAPPHWWPKEIKQISNGTWKFQGTSEYYLEGHIQDFMENTADSAHFHVVHDLNIIAKCCYMAKFFKHTWTSIKWSTYSENDSSAAARLGELHEISDILEYDLGEKHKSLILIDYEISILKIPMIGGRAPMLLNLVGPTCIEIFVKTCFGYIYMVHTVTPIKPRLHRVSHLVYAPTILAPLSKIVTLVDYFAAYGDAKIWKFKKYLQTPMLAKEDRYIKSFRRWYSQFYSENSPTYESCKNSTIEW